MNSAMVCTLEKHQLEAMIDAIPLMAWISSPDGSVSSYNKKWKEYVCGCENEMLDWQQYHYPDDIENIVYKMNEAICSGEDFHNEHRLKRFDGKYRWQSVRAVAMRDSDNEVLFWIGTATDIHDERCSKAELETQVKVRTKELFNLNKKLERLAEESSQMFESIPEIAWIADPEGINLYSNKKWHEYTGTNFAGAPNIGWETLIYIDDLSRTLDAWHASIQTGKDFEIECRFRRSSDGMYRWHLVRAVANKDAAGHITKWFGTSTDIHEQKSASEKLISSSALLNEAQELAHIGNWEMNLETQNIYWSDELFRVFGYDPQKFEPSFEHFFGIVHPEDLHKIHNGIDKVMYENMSLYFNYRIIRPDGKIRIISASKRAICDKDGNIIAMRGTCHDITELKESQRFIQQISNASPGIIAVYDLNLKANIYVNREINAVLGYSNEEKLEMNSSVFEKVVHPEDQKMFFKFLKSALDFSDEETREVECRIRNAKGDWLWFRIRMKVFKRDFSGKVYQVIGIGQDVTDRKKLEEETISLKLSKQKEIVNAILHAQEGERERIGEALHNGLGQLLYAIKLNLENFKLKIGADTKKDLGVINEINLLLVEAIDEARRISFELMPGILKDFGLEIALREMNKKVSKDFNVHWKIGGLNQRLTDDLEIAIFRIIQELINNIIKHAKVNEARVNLIKRANIINILVEDKGAGFEIDKGGLLHKGTGLQTIKNRVKLLNGTMDMTSKPGHGTLVNIEIDEINYSK
jgi:two-component system, NarL family, sensor kinase